MEKQTWPLLNLLEQSEELPEYAVNITKIFSEWERKNLLVAQVMAGKTTFEKAISPLIEENLLLNEENKDACNSEKFEKITKSAEEKFSGIMTFHNYFATMNLSGPFKWTKIQNNHQWEGFGLKLLMFCPFISILLVNHWLLRDFNLFLLITTFAMGVYGIISLRNWGLELTKEDVKCRKNLAEVVLNNAKFLDNMADKAKKKFSF